MTTALTLAAAILLPWAAGTAWLRALASASSKPPPLASSVAYGELAGIALLTILMRAASLAGIPWSFRGLSFALAVLLAAALVSTPFLRRRRPSARSASIALPDPLAWRWLTAIAALMLAVRFGSLAYEIVLQPLYPWDAWTQWATKAKVWSALHTMAPFIGYDQWLAREPGYVDTASHYPATMPLLQAWVALALGRFDDALVNLPWLAIFVALGAGIYSQLRGLGVGTPWALFVAYLALSMPLLDTHVALAGYADLPVGAVFTLGVLALMRWEQERDAMQLVCLGLSLALLPTLKVPGLVWAATLLLGLLIAVFGRTPGKMAMISLAVAGATALAAAALFRAKLVSVAAQGGADIAQPLATNLFLYDNWHLLWYALPAAVVLGWRHALQLRGTSATLLAGMMFLWLTFALTRAGNWVADYTTVNRALLHIAPAALVFAAFIFWKWASGYQSTAAPKLNTPAGPAVEKASSG